MGGGMGGGMPGGLDFSSLLNGGASGGSGGSAPPVADAATRFASQLQQLRDMGFAGRLTTIPNFTSSSFLFHIDSFVPTYLSYPCLTLCISCILFFFRCFACLNKSLID